MRIFLIILGIFTLFTGAALAVLSHPAFGLWRHRSTEHIQASPNFYDGMFQNQEPTPQFTGDHQDGKNNAFGTLWRFLTNKDTLRAPQEPITAIKTDLHALPTDTDWLVWFGHSSYLFCLNGMRFLVDPVLQPEWPSSMMLKAFPGTDIYRPNDLPEIDVLIITHEHWDHMDYATLRDIRTKVKMVICPLGIADYLRYWGYADEQIVELDWYDSFDFERSGLLTSLSLKMDNITRTGNIFTLRPRTLKRSSLTYRPSKSSPSTTTSIRLLCTRGTNPTAWHIISLQNTIFNFSTLQLEPLCIIKHDKLAEYGQFGTINGQIGRQMNFGTFIATFKV